MKALGAARRFGGPRSLRWRSAGHHEWFGRCVLTVALGWSAEWGLVGCASSHAGLGSTARTPASDRATTSSETPSAAAEAPSTAAETPSAAAEAPSAAAEAPSAVGPPNAADPSHASTQQGGPPSAGPARSETQTDSADRANPGQARSPAWIGISMLQTEDGVVVEQIIPGSPAARAGLLPGDRLMRIAGEAVSTPSDVSAIVANHQAGAHLSVDFRRGDAVRLLKLQTSAKPDTEQLLRHLYVGQPAPSLSSLRTVQGSVVPSLVQLEGRVVVLEFWASWCVACRAMSETLNRWHEDLSVLGVSVLGVTMDPYEEAVRATKLLELRYPTFSDESGDVTRDYRAMSLPTLFVIDKAGIIRDVMVGLHFGRMEEMGARLKQLALEQPTAASLQGAKGPALDE